MSKLTERGVGSLVGSALATAALSVTIGSISTATQLKVDSRPAPRAHADATELIDVIRRATHDAAGAVVLPASSDSSNSELILYSTGFGSELARFTWASADSLVHHGLAGSTDNGPVVTSIARRFRAWNDDQRSIHLEVELWDGQRTAARSANLKLGAQP
jgi:hypothetical protein